MCTVIINTLDEARMCWPYKSKRGRKYKENVGENILGNGDLKFRGDKTVAL